MIVKCKASNGTVAKSGVSHHLGGESETTQKLANKEKLVGLGVPHKVLPDAFNSFQVVILEPAKEHSSLAFRKNSHNLLLCIVQE